MAGCVCSERACALARIVIACGSSLVFLVRLNKLVQMGASCLFLACCAAGSHGSEAQHMLSQLLRAQPWGWSLVSVAAHPLPPGPTALASHGV
jgi:hypothetical protein